MKNKLLAGVALGVVLGGVVYAGTTIKPFRASGGVQMVSTPRWNGPDGGGGIYYKQDMGLAFHSINGTDTVLGSGGGGGSGTLATTYSNGASQTDSTITLDSTRLGVIVKDASSTIGASLFTVANNAVNYAYFQVSPNGTNALNSGGASGGLALKLSTQTSWSGGTLVSVQNAGTQKFGIDFAGNLSLNSQVTFTGASSVTNTTAITLAPAVADGASSVAFKVNNASAPATSGFAYQSWQANSVEAAALFFNGSNPVFGGNRGGSGSGIGLNTSELDLYPNVSGSPVIFVGGSNIAPFSDNTIAAGASGRAWSTTWSHHFAGYGTPTKATGACLGGTTSVTLDANANDAAGTMTLASSAVGTASSTCATITFNSAYSTAPHCQVAPANAAAAALSGTAQLYVDAASTTVNGFAVKVGSTALGSGSYLVTYDCTQ